MPRKLLFYKAHKVTNKVFVINPEKINTIDSNQVVLMKDREGTDMKVPQINQGTGKNKEVSNSGIHDDKGSVAQPLIDNDAAKVTSTITENNDIIKTDSNKFKVIGVQPKIVKIAKRNIIKATPSTNSEQKKIPIVRKLTVCSPRQLNNFASTSKAQENVSTTTNSGISISNTIKVEKEDNHTNSSVSIKTNTSTETKNDKPSPENDANIKNEPNVKPSTDIQVLNRIPVARTYTNRKKDPSLSTSLLKSKFTKMSGTADKLLIHAPNSVKAMKVCNSLNSENNLPKVDTVTKKSNLFVVYNSHKGQVLSPGESYVFIRHGYDANVGAIRTTVAIRTTKPILDNVNIDNVNIETSKLVLCEASSDSIVKVIGQSNYETVFNTLLQITDEYSRVQGILALLNCNYNINNLNLPQKIAKKFTDKSCQTNESAIREIEEIQSKILLQKRNKYNKKKPYVVTDKHTKLLEIGQKLIIMNDDGNVTQSQLKMDNNELVNNEVNEPSVPNDDNYSIGNLSCLSTNTEQLALLYQKINQVTKTDEPVCGIPNLAGQDLFDTRVITPLNTVNNQKGLKPSEQAHTPISTVHSPINEMVTNIQQTEQVASNSSYQQISGQMLPDFSQISSYAQKMTTIGPNFTQSLSSHIENQNNFNQSSFNNQTQTLCIQNQSNLVQTQLNTAQKTFVSSNNMYKITMSDEYEIWVPYKPEDEFHQATPENLRALSPQDQRKLILHQAYIDFKYALTMDEDGHYPIHQAVLANDPDWLKRQFCALRMRNKNVDILSAGNLTALQMSLYCETSTCCTTLIQFGADPMLPDEDGRVILHLAVERGADQLSDIVHACVAHARAIVSEHEELQTAGWESRTDEDLGFVLMNYLNTMVDDAGYTPLMLASKMGHYENVRILLESTNSPGLIVDFPMPTSGNTALYLAVSAVCTDCQENGNISHVAENLSKTIEYLIQNGASLEKQNYAGINANNLAIDLNSSGLNSLIARIMAKKYNLHSNSDAKSLMLFKNIDGSIEKCSKPLMIVKTIDGTLEKCFVPETSFPRSNIGVKESMAYDTKMKEVIQSVQRDLIRNDKTQINSPTIISPPSLNRKRMSTENVASKTNYNSNLESAQKLIYNLETKGSSPKVYKKTIDVSKFGKNNMGSVTKYCTDTKNMNSDVKKSIDSSQSFQQYSSNNQFVFVKAKDVKGVEIAKSDTVNDELILLDTSNSKKIQRYESKCSHKTGNSGLTQNESNHIRNVMKDMKITKTALFNGKLNVDSNKKIVNKVKVLKVTKSGACNRKLTSNKTKIVIKDLKITKSDTVTDELILLDTSNSKKIQREPEIKQFPKTAPKVVIKRLKAENPRFSQFPQIAPEVDTNLVDNSQDSGEKTPNIAVLDNSLLKPPDSLVVSKSSGSNSNSLLNISPKPEKLVLLAGGVKRNLETDIEIETNAKIAKMSDTTSIG